VTTALYRRYRPETFAEVVGQDHVTGPLRQALRSGQINHAYLFSGPRGCGKTTSARILARCLNCAEGPTDTPCGVCPSCVELARGGPGSLDVVEIDAASHGGVDDARDLRERATFAPARDRYKVFILDEAHMVSPQGFNALLKIVEEPPEHVKFIFATTEPDKVIGTIRSRTHHYPFRLVPPEIMTDYLGQICATEGIATGSGVLPLVVRAGGGSVRDSLSVLDQLIAGSGPQGLVYEDAVALLGYTHASLLDDLVDAIAARDGASAFRVVERVISTGHEPRRFVEDLLERLRDLIVLQASGEAADAVLRDIPGDQLTRMRTQAQHLGASELSRSADLANAALTEMSGATSPRLHLELLMARLLLPAMDDSAAGLGARVDRLERTGVTGGGAPAQPVATNPVTPVTPVERVAVVTAPVDGGAGASPETAASGAALARAAMAAAGRGDAGTPVRAPEPATTAPARPQDSPAASADDAGTATAPHSAGLAASPADGPVPATAPQGAGPTSAPANDAPLPAATPEDAGDRSPEAPVTTGEADDADIADGRTQDAAGAMDESAAVTAVAPADSAPAGQQDAPRQEPAGWEDVPAAQPVAVVTPQPTAPLTEVESDPVAATASVPAGGAPADPGPAPTARTGAGQDTEMLRRRWPEVLETLAGLKKTTWVLISQNAQVIELDATTLKLGFTAPGLATAFRNGPHAELVHQAVRETLGFDVRVEGVLAGDGPAARPEADRPGAAVPSAPAPEATAARATGTAREHDSAPTATPVDGGDDDAPADPWAQATPADPSDATARDGGTQEAAGAWPEVAPIPGSSGGSATASPSTVDGSMPTADGPAAAGSSSDTDWPAVAPIPGDAAWSEADADSAPGARPATAAVDDADAGQPTATGHDGPADAAVRAAATPEPTVDASPAAAVEPRPGVRTDAGESRPGVRTDAGEPRPGVRTDAGSAGDDRVAAATRDSARELDQEPPLADEPPPPWDDPEDPGMPEPPEDPWAAPSTAPRAATAPTGTAPSAAAPTGTAPTGTAPTGTAPSGSGAGRPPTPGAPLSGADRVRAAMMREPVTVTPTRTPNWADDEPSMDDPDISASGMAGIQLVAQALGGVIIEEQIDDQ